MLARIDRYTAAAVARPLLPLTAVLVLVFASFDAARTLADFDGSKLGAVTLLQLVALKTLIALDVLLPLALYLAAIIGLAGLHQRHEIIALRSLGVSPTRTALGILGVALVVALVAGAISLVARPWGYSQVYALESALEARFDIANLTPDHFRTHGDGRVTYAHQRSREGRGLQGFIVYERSEQRTRITLSAHAAESGERKLLLSDARTYSLDRQGLDDRIQALGELTVDLGDPVATADNGRKTVSTQRLWQSRDPVEVAERQWRLSRPVATILLALLAIPLSACAPRRGPYARVVVAFVLFAVYFAISDIARSWVEQALVPAFPGIWWPHVLIAVLLVATAQPWRRSR